MCRSSTIMNANFSTSRSHVFFVCTCSWFTAEHCDVVVGRLTYSKLILKATQDSAVVETLVAFSMSFG